MDQQSGMGGYDAAEAHLNGLYTLINMRCPEEWQHRIWGILQRVILMYVLFNFPFLRTADRISSYPAPNKFQAAYSIPLTGLEVSSPQAKGLPRRPSGGSRPTRLPTRRPRTLKQSSQQVPSSPSPPLARLGCRRLTPALLHAWKLATPI